MFHKIARFVKSMSFMMLNWQSNFLQKRLIKKIGYKKVVDGCTVDISQEMKARKEKIDADVRAILKQCKNNPILVLEYFEKNNLRCYFVKRANKVLKRIGETEGFITKRTGYSALALSLITKSGFKFETPDFVILEEEEPDIYKLINALYKWYSKKEGMEGFDEKSQKLLKKFNPKNEDKLIKKLSLEDITLLKNAIARDVQAIEFVSQYSKENAGSKKALEKMQSDKGASI